MSDRDVLEALYAGSHGPRWVHRDNWLSSRHLGEWYGVRTDEITGRVWALDLPANRLYWKLTPCLGELDELVQLDLSVNSLEGPIPPELANCRKLKILLFRDNDLEGRIPGEFGSLRRLEELALDNNRMDGAIPAELGECASMRGLWLSGCSFSGRIPGELAECAALQVLDLAHNDLTGEIPGNLGALHELQQLHLVGNPLRDSIPERLWWVRSHDLDDLAEQMGRHATGHILPGGIHGREIRIMTCPEWPSRELIMKLRKLELSKGITEGELVWILYTEDPDGTLWAENLTSRAEKERGDEAK